MATRAVTSRHKPVHGLHARVLGRVDLDHARLDADLAAIQNLPLNSGYSDYSRGNPGWRNCVLANHSGDANDHVFEGHNQRAVATEHLAGLPYIAELLDTVFNRDHVLWARLFICHDGMLIPHRDYLDLPEDEFTRVHLALRRGPRSLHSEHDKVFRMREGEIWFVDGTVDHAASSFDGVPRTYLTCDFPAGIAFDELVPDPNIHGRRDVPDFVTRAPLPDDFHDQLRGLAQLTDTTGVDDAIALLSRVHLMYDVDCGQVYDWLADAAAEVGNTAVATVARERRRYFLGD